MAHDFGHVGFIGNSICIDVWGDAQYTLRVGKRRYYFTDSDRFGPYLETKNGYELANQPISERHPFWPAYHMWRKGGRKFRMVKGRRVCRWRMPRKGQYWMDSKGISHFIRDPEFDTFGYEKVDKPEATP